MSETMNPADSQQSYTGQSFWARHRNWLTALALVVLALGIYLPSMHYDYVYYDDVRILRDHPELYGQPDLGANIQAIFTANLPREEPLLLRDLSWAVDARIFGFDNPFGYHFGNVMLNAVVVALVFAFLWTSTRRYKVSLATAAFFLLLATHVEPVAWIMGRKDILSALFMLLALCAQTRRVYAIHGIAKYGWYAVTFLCFSAALLSKISVLTFPLVLFLHAIFLPWLRGERPPNAPFEWKRSLLREVFLGVPLLAVSGGVYVWYQGNLAAMGIFDRGYHAHGFAHFWNLLMINPFALWIYLKQIFLPSSPAVLYAWPTVLPAYPPWQVVTALLTVAGFLAAGIWLLVRRKDLFFFFAAFFVLMIPYLNLIYIGIWVAERYIYFSGICVLACAALLGADLWRKGGRPVRWALLFVVVGLAGNNIAWVAWYQPKWENAESLWSYHVIHTPDSPKAYENLAAYYYAEFGRAVECRDEARMALTLRKMETVVHAGLLQFWPDQRQPPPPCAYFLFFLRSLIQEVTGQPEEALKSLLVADQLHPNFDSINLNLSRLYKQLAGTRQDIRQREADLHSSRERFANYIRLVYRSRPPPPAVAAEMARLEAECAALPPAPAN